MRARGLLFIEEDVALAGDHRATWHARNSIVIVLVPLAGIRVLTVGRVVAGVRRARMVRHAVQTVRATCYLWRCKLA